MQSKDITVGADYAVNLYGTTTGRHAPYIGSDRLVRCTVVSAPKDGVVKCHTDDTPDLPRFESVRRFLGTWDEHAAILAAGTADRDEWIARYTADDVRAREVLGDTYDDVEVYIGFKVYSDGSYPTNVSGMPRSTFAEVLEAAYAAGQASGR